MGLFARLVEALKPAPEPAADVREAAGLTIDDDEDQWRRLTGNTRRDLSPMTHDRMLELAVYLWRTNPLANRLIELPVAYLLAEGVKVTVKDEEVQGWLDAFWRDPINRLDIKLPKKVRELSLYGEQCWPAFVNEINGHVRLGYIDPAQIATVVTDPDNVEQPIGVVLKQDNKGRKRRFRVIINGPESVFTMKTQAIRETFADGDCFFFKVNDLSNTTRGQSDLLASADWLDGYDQFLFGELDRSSFLRAFIWDVTLKGATKDEVRTRAKEISVPPPGSTRIHNEQEEWSAVSPQLHAAESETNARLFRNHVLGGGTLPEHWFGGGGDVNRSTGESMSEPTFKIFSVRQAIVGYILEEIATFVIRRRLDAVGGGAPAHEDMPEEYVPNVEWPEMTVRDTTKYAQALQQVVVAAATALDRGLLSEATAVAVIAIVAGRLGLEVDPQAELEAAKEEAAVRAEEDSFPDVPEDPDLDDPEDEG